MKPGSRFGGRCCPTLRAATPEGQGQDAVAISGPDDPYPDNCGTTSEDPGCHDSGSLFTSVTNAGDQPCTNIRGHGAFVAASTSRSTDPLSRAVAVCMRGFPAGSAAGLQSSIGRLEYASSAALLCYTHSRGGCSWRAPSTPRAGATWIRARWIRFRADQMEQPGLAP
jgi:hypothetical protein